MENKDIIIWVIVWVIIWFLLAKIFFLSKNKHNRQDAVKRSKSVLLGQINEQITPLLPNFEYNIKDLVFLWKWVDYIIFDGLAEWELRQIIFLEIKTWKSQLNRNEKMIKSKVDWNHVFYETMRL